MTATVAQTRLRAVLLTALAMVAFAGNSLLCRMALYEASIDPASFTTIRFLSGAIALSFILLSTGKLGTLRQSGGWLSAAVLVFYAITFSYAYVSLGAGTGALILFGCVQGTMIVVGLWRGDRPGPIEWLGWVIAFGGLVWLMLPGIEAPPLTGALLMAAAGVGWGMYSILGQHESDPIASNATNFILSLPVFCGTRHCYLVRRIVDIAWCLAGRDFGCAHIGYRLHHLVRGTRLPDGDECRFGPAIGARDCGDRRSRSPGRTGNTQACHFDGSRTRGHLCCSGQTPSLCLIY